MENQTQEVGKVRTSPKDFFLHLGIIVTLYASAISLVNLLFAIINKAYPDALSYYDGSANTIKWTVASLIIMFPIYILLGWLFNRELKTNPEKKWVGIRKWLVYLTLFIAGLVLAIDLVTLVYTFLGGEITIRFILKVLAVFVVAGLIFAYYIYDLMHDVASRLKSFKIFALVGVVLVLASIIVGFVIIGSPLSQRKLQFDQQRVYDLQNIQSQVTSYWQQKGVLPQSLDNLKNALSGYVVPVDPETNKPYTYQAIGTLSFKVCAVFDLETPKSTIRSTPAYYGQPEDVSSTYWNHGVGESCFERTIDPELYPRTTTKGATIKAPTIY